MGALLTILMGSIFDNAAENAAFKKALLETGQRLKMFLAPIEELGDVVTLAARDVGLDPIDLLGAGEVLVNQKVTEEERLDRLSIIGRAVKAEGADSRDVARTLRFAEEVLQVSPSEHEDFLSGLAAAGEEGGFRFKDFAEFAPQAIEQYGQLGLTGADEAAVLGSLFQIAFENSESAIVAADRTISFLKEIVSPELREKLPDSGAGLDKALKDASESGDNPLGVIARHLYEAIGGDPVKFGDPSIGAQLDSLADILSDQEAQMIGAALIETYKPSNPGDGFKLSDPFFEAAKNNSDYIQKKFAEESRWGALDYIIEPYKSVGRREGIWLNEFVVDSREKLNDFIVENIQNPESGGKSNLDLNKDFLFDKKHKFNEDNEKLFEAVNNPVGALLAGAAAKALLYGGTLLATRVAPSLPFIILGQQVADGASDWTITDYLNDPEFSGTKGGTTIAHKSPAKSDKPVRNGPSGEMPKPLPRVKPPPVPRPKPTKPLPRARPQFRSYETLKDAHESLGDKLRNQQSEPPSKQPVINFPLGSLAGALGAAPAALASVSPQAAYRSLETDSTASRFTKSEVTMPTNVTIAQTVTGPTAPEAAARAVNTELTRVASRAADIAAQTPMSDVA